MKAPLARRRTLHTLLAVLLVPTASGALPHAAAQDPEAPVRLTQPTDLVEIVAAEPLLEAPRNGRKAIRQLGDALPSAAARNDLTPAELRTLLRTDETAWLDPEGALYYVDPAPENVATTPLPSEPVAPLDETFTLNSNPGADLTIFLDVDGADVSGTRWNTHNGVAPGAHPAWDPAGNGPAFTDAELLKVQQVWAIVAEDYAPFDVNVTTQDPGSAALTRSSYGDTAYGTRVLITPSDDPYAQVCERQCGGVAYVGSFDVVGGSVYQPAWVFPQALGNDAKAVAEAASHEAGHNLGLSHDGTATQGYYAGHGVWAPIMGVGYNRPLTQWSRGSYAGASNQQDDLAILTGYLGVRPDEASGALSAPSQLPGGTALIGTNGDVDAYALGSCAAGSVVEVTPSAYAPNLDVRASLYDAAGALREISRPQSGFGDGITATGLGASLTVPEAGDGWIVTVEGAAEGTWATGGYDAYGSLGTYTVAAPGCADTPVDGTPGEPRAVVVSGETGTDSLTLTWEAPDEVAGVPVTGYDVSRTGTTGTVRLPADASSHTFTGLAPGTSYDLSVRAVNVTGNGRWVTVRATTQEPPPSVPSPPRNLVGLHNLDLDRLEVYWAPPEDAGSQPIIAYAIFLDGSHLGEVSAQAGGAYVTRETGFVDGEYVVGVAAVSAVGLSSTAEVTVTVNHPVRPPNDDIANAVVLTGPSGRVEGDNTHATPEPIDVTPMGAGGAGGHSVWYSWTAADTGWVTLTGTATGEGRRMTLAVIEGEPGLLWEVPGMSYGGAQASGGFKAYAGTRYHFAVDGFAGAGGTGPFTLTWDQTPEVRPEAPRNVTAKPRVNAALVSWDAPDGGVPTGYTVTSSPGGKECSTWQHPHDVTPPVQECTVTGLTNGQAYTFSVTASNSAGQSPSSEPSAAVTPRLDTTPPQVAEMKVTPDRVSAFGGQVTVRVRVADDLSGLEGTPTVSLGSGTLTRLKLISGDAWDGVYGATLWVPAGGALGSQRLLIYPLDDAAGNSTFFIDGPEVVVGAPATPDAPDAKVTGERRVQLTWTAPDPDGNVIDSYEVQFVPTGQRFTTAATSYVHDVTDRAADAPVSYRVRAHNAGGWSAWSAASADLVVPALAPGVPGGVEAVASDGSARVAWEASSGNGAVVSGYTVTARTGGSVAATVEVAGDVTSVVVPGLVNGTAYRFTVSATNAVGTSAESEPSSAVTPAAVPDAPSITSVVPGNGQATVTWESAGDNGSKITGHRVITYEGQYVRGVVQAPADATSVVVRGLTNKKAYTFAVVAENELGDSLESSRSAPVTPRAPAAVAKKPKRMKAPTVKARGKQAIVRWKAAKPNGARVTRYLVDIRPNKKVKDRSVKGGARKVAFKKLRPGTYRVRVAARNKVGTSRYSKWVKFRIR